MAEPEAAAWGNEIEDAACSRRSEGFSDWERQFVRELLRRCPKLTSKQVSKLCSIAHQVGVPVKEWRDG